MCSSQCRSATQSKTCRVGSHREDHTAPLLPDNHYHRYPPRHSSPSHRPQKQYFHHHIALVSLSPHFHRLLLQFRGLLLGLCFGLPPFLCSSSREFLGSYREIPD